MSLKEENEGIWKKKKQDELWSVNKLTDPNKTDKKKKIDRVSLFLFEREHRSYCYVWMVGKWLKCYKQGWVFISDFMVILSQNGGCFRFSRGLIDQINLIFRTNLESISGHYLVHLVCTFHVTPLLPLGPSRRSTFLNGFRTVWSLKLQLFIHYRIILQHFLCDTILLRDDVLFDTDPLLKMFF